MKQGKSISPDWNFIKSEYIESDIAQRPLAKKYGVVYKTLQQRASREKWFNQRKDFKVKLGAVLIEKNVNVIANEIKSLQEKERKEVNLIKQAILKKLIKDGGINPNLTPKDVNALASAFEKIQRVIYKSYGIADKHEIEFDKEKPLPLDITIEYG